MSVTYYKMRQNFSSGYGEWTFHETEEPWNDETLKEIARESHDEYDWSEHYRGCDIEKVEMPPWEWINKEMGSSLRQAQYAQRRYERLRILRRECHKPGQPHRYRALARVVNLRDDGIAEVVFPGWPYQVTVEVPRSILPENAAVDSRYHAQIDFGAENAADLNPTDWEWE
jgi:hypothetical protein